MIYSSKSICDTFNESVFDLGNRYSIGIEIDILSQSKSIMKSLSIDLLPDSAVVGDEFIISPDYSKSGQGYRTMVDISDDVIGHVVESVKELGIFMIDNDGETRHGDNLICRNKNVLHEGGSEIRGYLSDSMNNKMHVTHWYPVILSILNEDCLTKQSDEYSRSLQWMELINQWLFLNGETNDKSIKNDTLYNIDVNLCVKTTKDNNTDS